MIVDIRDRIEYNKRNVDGSINIPERHLKDSIDLLNSFDEVVLHGLRFLRIWNLAAKHWCRYQ